MLIVLKALQERFTKALQAGLSHAIDAREASLQLLLQLALEAVPRIFEVGFVSASIFRCDLRQWWCGIATLSLWVALTSLNLMKCLIYEH